MLSLVGYLSICFLYFVSSSLLRCGAPVGFLPIYGGTIGGAGGGGANQQRLYSRVLVYTYDLIGFSLVMKTHYLGETRPLVAAFFSTPLPTYPNFVFHRCRCCCFFFARARRRAFISFTLRVPPNCGKFCGTNV